MKREKQPKHGRVVFGLTYFPNVKFVSIFLTDVFLNFNIKVQNNLFCIANWDTIEGFCYCNGKIIRIMFILSF